MEPRIPLIREHNFAAADAGDQLVFGACRPGFPNKRVAPSEVDGWLSFMARKDISRVPGLATAPVVVVAIVVSP